MVFRSLGEIVHIENGRYLTYDFDTWREISELKVEAGEQDPHEDWIRGVGFQLQVPRLVRLLRYDRVPSRSVRFSRRNVFLRDDHRCQYCGDTFPASKLSLDHVQPRSRQGQTTWENIVCCCLRCNAVKGGRTPEEASMRLIRRPAKPKRNPLLSTKLGNPKYASWKTFLAGTS